MTLTNQLEHMRAHAIATLDEMLARLDALTAATVDKIRAQGDRLDLDQAKIEDAITVIRQEHELERARMTQQRAAILAGAPWWPVDPLQV
jgi:hypothetical protein